MVQYCRSWFVVLVCVLGVVGSATAKNCPAQGTCACGDTVTASYTLSASDPVTTTTCDPIGLFVAGASCDAGGGTCTSNLCVGGDNAGQPCGVVLDGAGRTIAGATPAACTPNVCASDSAGVMLAGTAGATVKNLTITGFRAGVQLQKAASGAPASGNLVTAVTVRNNGNATSHEGYGVAVLGSEDNQLLGLTIENAADQGVHIEDSDGTVLAERYGAYCNAIKTTVKNSYRENIYVRDADDNTIANTESAYPAPNSCASSGACVGAWIEDSDGNSVRGTTFADKGIILVGESASNRIGETGTTNAVSTPRLEFRNTETGSPNANRIINVTVTSVGSSHCVVFKNPRHCVGGPSDGESCTQAADCTDGTCVRPTTLAHGNVIRTPATFQNCGPEIQASSKECVGGSTPGADCDTNADCTGGGTCQTYGDPPASGDQNMICGATCPDDGTCNESDPNAIVTVQAADCP